MTNNNYVDARTPEEIANAPKGVITYASSMNNNTLKERDNWEDKFAKLIPKNVDILHEIRSDRIFCSRQSVVNFIEKEIQQAKEEEKNRIVEMIERTFDGCSCGFHGYKVLPDCETEEHVNCARCIINQISNTK